MALNTNDPRPPHRALLSVLELLKAERYAFTTVTPATHARVLARRPSQQAASLRDVFGWSLPFAQGLLAPELFDAMHEAEILSKAGDGWRSTLRVSTVLDLLFFHSAYPAVEKDAVFLGPDTYRFVSFILQELRQHSSPKRILEVGAGPGSAGVLAGVHAPQATVTLTDINPEALRLARVNARSAGREVEVIRSVGLDEVPGRFDLVIANPPFMMDSEGRTYRDGGELQGAQLSLEWALSAAERLEPGGRCLLYTGVAIVDGRDRLKAELLTRLSASGCDVAYREIDPDIFGEELETPAYAEVERIAAVGAVITRHDRPG